MFESIKASAPSSTTVLPSIVEGRVIFPVIEVGFVHTKSVTSFELFSLYSQLKVLFPLVV